MSAGLAGCCAIKANVTARRPLATPPANVRRSITEYLRRIQVYACYASSGIQHHPRTLPLVNSAISGRCRLTNQANRPRADGAQAPPASGPVERVVRPHRFTCSGALELDPVGAQLAVHGISGFRGGIDSLRSLNESRRVCFVPVHSSFQLPSSVWMTRSSSTAYVPT